jgi:hypothetical protein
MGKACGTNWEKRNAYMILTEEPEGKSSVGNLELDGKIILKWILKKTDGKA